MVLPGELLPTTPTPAPSSAVPEPAPILRAPRYSPDGAALAYVDMSGRVGVLELPGDRLTTARFAAVSPPAWLPDSTGVLLSGSPGGSLEPAEPGQPVKAMDPGGLDLTSFELGALRLARLERGAAAVAAARPAVRLARVLRRDRAAATSSSRCRPRPAKRAAPCG